MKIGLVCPYCDHDLGEREHSLGDGFVGMCSCACHDGFCDPIGGPFTKEILDGVNAIVNGEEP